MDSLQDAIRNLQQSGKLPRLTVLPPNSPPLLQRYPGLVNLSAEATARLTCGPCYGSGQRPHTDLACEPCRGTGLVCPACRGAHWVRDDRYGYGDTRRAQVCPACRTPAEQNATILAYIQEAP